MSKYTAKNALVDLGFIDGYFHEADNVPKHWGMWEALLDALQRLEEYAIYGHLTEHSGDAASYARFLHDLGFLRGLIWSHPISSAVSEALGRVIAFVTDNDHFPCQLLAGCGETAEPVDLRLSDEQRQRLLNGTKTDDDPTTAEFARLIGATYPAVLDYWRKLGAISGEEMEEELKATDQAKHQAVDEATLPKSNLASRDVNPFNPSGKRGTREWTAEQRAAQSERARGQKKPPFDEQLDAVKADWEAGLTFRAMGRKYGCSEQHIRNFLTRHGIDPRRKDTLAKASEESHPGLAEPAQPCPEERHQSVQPPTNRDTEESTPGEAPALFH